MNEKTDQEWHAISVTVPKEGSDWISHLLFELGSVGNLEEESPDPALIAMKGYFPTEIGSSTAIIQSILGLLDDRGIKPLSTYSTTLKIQNWAEAACQMFSPIRVLKDTTIVSPWSDYKARSGEEVIVINPGMAFGTGLHATTRLAARLMVRCQAPVDNFYQKLSTGAWHRMCDVGCGSGILSIIAYKKGIKDIDAIEIDHDARISARENITNNGCGSAIKLLDNIDQAMGQYDLVVANILYATLIELKERLLERIADGGSLVISGITTEEDEKFLEKFADPAIKLELKEIQDGWVGYLFRLCRSSW